MLGLWGKGALCFLLGRRSCWVSGWLGDGEYLVRLVMVWVGVCFGLHRGLILSMMMRLRNGKATHSVRRALIVMT